MSTTLSTPEADLISSFTSPKMQEIASRALQGTRLSFDDGLHLFSADKTELLLLADKVREKKVGDTVYFANTIYIHPTNLCELSCPMCSFYAKPGWKKAWFLSPEDIESKVLAAYREQNITEVHIVGGLWRDCDLPYYQDVFSRIKAIDPDLHIKAMTPVEYHFLAELHNISIQEVFRRMKSWGLGSLPGGGAEVLVEHIRKQVAPQKISSEEFLSIHKIAHEEGIPSNITMLFGHVEDEEHLLTHMCKIRELQDETNGFRTFIPLKFHLENNALGKRKNRLKEKDTLKVYAVSRLMLDNIFNIKALWNYLGIEEALKILQAGSNDLAATQLGERIITMAGGVQVKMTRELLSKLISDIGRSPKEIHSGYDYTQDRP